MTDEDFLEIEDEEAVAVATKRQEKAAESRKQRWSAVLASENGRAVLFEILEKCGLSHSSYIPGDPYATTFNEGGRNKGIWLLAECSTITPGWNIIAEREKLERDMRENS